MSKRTLWVSIESITTFVNGDVPGQNAPAASDKRNAVLGTLTYPRSGAPTVTSGQQYNLPNFAPEDQVFHPDPKDFFASGLFKEEVQDETLLQIKITDTDRSSKAEKVFAVVLGIAFKAATGLAIGQLTSVFGSVAAEGVEQLRTGWKKLGDDQVYVIGQTDTIRLEVDSLPTDKNQPLRMALGLTVPDDIEKPFIEMDENGRPVTKHLRLPKGTPNGEIVLRIAAVPAEPVIVSAAATPRAKARTLKSRS